MLRRSNPWDPPTFIDRLLLSPLALFIDYIHALILTLRGPSVKPPKNKPPIRFVCISDTHDHKVELPAGDVLIHAGDLTNSGTTKDIQAQLDWLESLPGFKYKILVAGNHDSFFDAKSRKEEDKGRKLNFHKLHFLQNETLQIKLKGGRTLTVYGAADIPRCGGSDFAFQYDPESPPWRNRIPISTDVLVTHTPPKHHLDIDKGCPSLLEEIWRVKPRLHVVGHVHSGHGRQYMWWDEAQASYERIMGRKGGVTDLIPNPGWIDAIKVIWHGVRGIFWQYLMAGQRGGNGGLLINAALVYQSTSNIGNKPEIVDL